MKKLIVLLIVGILILPIIFAQSNYFDDPEDLIKLTQNYEGLMLPCPEFININSIKSVIEKHQDGVRYVEDNELNSFVEECNKQPFFWVQPLQLSSNIKKCMDGLSSKIGNKAKFLTEEIREECIIEDNFRKNHFFLRIFRPGFYNSLLEERQIEIKQGLIEDFDNCGGYTGDSEVEFSCEDYRFALENDIELEEGFGVYKPRGVVNE